MRDRYDAAVRHPAIASLALVLIVIAAGCGSGSKASGSKSAASGATGSGSAASGSGSAANSSPAGATSSRLYSLALTKRCLDRQKGSKAAAIKTSAISGSRGNLRVSFGFGAGEIYLAFAKDATEARTLENRAVALTERHEQIDRKTILAGVHLTHNVFYYSSAGPVTVVLNQKITSCLH